MKMILLAKAQIIGGIVPNLIAFVLFLGAIGYFALTGKMAEMFGWKRKEKPQSPRGKSSRGTSEGPFVSSH